MKSHAELTKKHLQVLPHLLSCPTCEEAARQANVLKSYRLKYLDLQPLIQT